MRRITPDEAAEAFRATGIEPVRRALGLKEGEPPCGCLLTALAAKEHGFEATRRVLRDRPSRVRLLTDMLGLTRNYVGGLFAGWDQQIRHENDPSFIAGYEDGKACYAAVEAAGLVAQGA